MEIESFSSGSPLFSFSDNYRRDSSYASVLDTYSRSFYDDYNASSFRDDPCFSIPHLSCVSQPSTFHNDLVFTDFSGFNNALLSSGPSSSGFFPSSPCSSTTRRNLPFSGRKASFSDEFSVSDSPNSMSPYSCPRLSQMEDEMRSPFYSSSMNNRHSSYHFHSSDRMMNAPIEREFIIPGDCFEKSLPPSHSNVNQNIPCSSSSISSMRCQQVKKNKKNKLKGNAEHYQIDPEKILQNEDLRQFLMIKNIPNSFTQDKLLAILEKFVKFEIEFLYLPLDKSTGCNLGYGYVSLVNHKSVLRLYNGMHLKRWPNSLSTKLCEFVYARIQGHRDYVRMCDKWSVMNDHVTYHPVFFKRVDTVINGVHHSRMIRSSFEELSKK